MGFAVHISKVAVSNANRIDRDRCGSYLTTPYGLPRGNDNKSLINTNTIPLFFWKELWPYQSMTS